MNPWKEWMNSSVVYRAEENAVYTGEKILG